MGAHADEVLRARLLVEGHEAFRVPLLRLPERDDVLVPVRGRVAVGGQMVLILTVARRVHVLGVPVACHRHGLRSPMSPDAELGVRNHAGHSNCFREFVVGPNGPGAIGRLVAAFSGPGPTSENHGRGQGSWGRGICMGGREAGFGRFRGSGSRTGWCPPCGSVRWPAGPAA